MHHCNKLNLGNRHPLQLLKCEPAWYTVVCHLHEEEVRVLWMPLITGYLDFVAREIPFNLRMFWSPL